MWAPSQYGQIATYLQSVTKMGDDQGVEEEKMELRQGLGRQAGCEGGEAVSAAAWGWQYLHKAWVSIY